MCRTKQPNRGAYIIVKVLFDSSSLYKDNKIRVYVIAYASSPSYGEKQTCQKKKIKRS